MARSAQPSASSNPHPPVSTIRLPQDPWAPRGGDDGGRNLHLLEPFERERTDDAEYLAAKVSDAESQIAALFARVQAFEDLKAEGALSAADGLAQEIMSLGTELQKTIRDAAQSLRPVPRVLQGADLQLRLRLLLVADRAELWAGLSDATGLLLAKHRALLSRRSIEPVYSFVLELTRLLDAMVPIRDAFSHFLGHGHTDLADLRAAELAQPEALFLGIFEQCAAHVGSFALNESVEVTLARIQLLLLGQSGTERLRMIPLERVMSHLVTLSTPPRTWPFPMVDASEEMLERVAPAGAKPEPGAGRSGLRRTLFEQFWSSDPNRVEVSPRSSSAPRPSSAPSLLVVTDVVESLAEFLDLADPSSVDRRRVEGLLRSLNSGAITTTDLEATILLTRLDERRVRLIARGHLLRPNSPIDGARLALVAHVLILLRRSKEARRRTGQANWGNEESSRPESVLFRTRL